MRRTLTELKSRWAEEQKKPASNSQAITPEDRVPVLNILAVFTMDTVLREWSLLDASTRQIKGVSYMQELEDFAVKPQGEAIVLVKNTPWFRAFAFDLPFDLARIHATRCLILDVIGPEQSESEFRQVLQSLSEARNAPATATQTDAALQEIREHIPLAGLDPIRREKMEKVMQIQ
jgi:hypothetical protein